MWHGAEGCSNLHVLPLHSIGQGEGRAWGPFPALHPWGSIPSAPKPNHTNPGSQYKRLKLIGFFLSKPVGGSRERSAMGWGVGGGGERGWATPLLLISTPMFCHHVPSRSRPLQPHWASSAELQRKQSPGLGAAGPIAGRCWGGPATPSLGSCEHTVAAPHHCPQWGLGATRGTSILK